MDAILLATASLSRAALVRLLPHLHRPLCHHGYLRLTSSSSDAMLHASTSASLFHLPISEISFKEYLDNLSDIGVNTEDVLVMSHITS